MAFVCLDCAFKGKDKYALDRHCDTDKHKEIVGKKLIDNLELSDIRLMNDDESKRYIYRHRYFRVEYCPRLAEHFKKMDRWNYIQKLLQENPSKLSPKEMALRKQEIKDEYPEDYEGDECKNRVEQLEYDLENIQELIDEKDCLLLYFTNEGMKITSRQALAIAEDTVRKRMLAELESVGIAKAKNDKKKAELELKIKLLELKNS